MLAATESPKLYLQVDRGQQMGPLGPEGSWERVHLYRVGLHLLLLELLQHSGSTQSLKLLRDSSLVTDLNKTNVIDT